MTMCLFEPAYKKEHLLSYLTQTLNTLIMCGAAIFYFIPSQTSVNKKARPLPSFNGKGLELALALLMFLGR